jgi:predicted amidophosphoribosyltransferase
MTVIKTDGYTRDPQGRLILMSQWVAQTIQQLGNALPFTSFFKPTATLIPTPKSSLMKADTLWVPDRLAKAFVEKRLGKEVVRCLVRVTPVPKAAYSAAEDRPAAAQHYETLTVQESFSEPAEIVLVDDIVTRGATLLGAANRLVDVFPRTRIHAFAVMRTVINPSEFEKTLPIQRSD